MSGHLEDLLFVLNMVDVLALYDLILFHCLQGKTFCLIILEIGYFDITKGTYSLSKRLVSVIIQKIFHED